MADKRVPQDTKLQGKFVGLWRRALTLPDLNDLNAQTVTEWAQQAGLTVLEAVERDVGLFRTTPSVMLTTEGGVAYFPKRGSAVGKARVVRSAVGATRPNQRVAQRR
jgi:hypothetical protein